MDAYFTRYKETVVKAKSTMKGQQLAVHFLNSLENPLFNQIVYDVSDNIRTDWWENGIENTFHKAKKHINRTSNQTSSHIRDHFHRTQAGNGSNGTRNGTGNGNGNEMAMATETVINSNRRSNGQRLISNNGSINVHRKKPSWLKVNPSGINAQSTEQYPVTPYWDATYTRRQQQISGGALSDVASSKKTTDTEQQHNSNPAVTMAMMVNEEAMMQTNGNQTMVIQTIQREQTET